ncbi:MAG: hypothetical protein JWM27_1623 [Gemmatimonadetes bacterium]|nr:hypothetical protein [Gemmatimonadota bacterium]
MLPQQPGRGVLVRDLLIFQAKLALDGLKGIFLFQASLVAAGIDFVLGRRKRVSLFYKVLELSERFDLWLNVYGASGGAGQNADGLFGTSQAGDDNLLGRLEQMVRKGDLPQRARRAARAGRGAWSKAG